MNTSVDELRVRGSQSLSAFVERASWSRSGRLRSEESFRRLLDISDFKSVNLLESFRSRSQPAFFPSFEDKTTTVVEFTRRWPQARRRILDQAERILSGRFDLLGLKELSFGTPIDWHFEPVMRKRVPRLHWSRLNYLDSQVAGDKKIVWELNRHQHFAVLGQAYWLTNDERYAQAFVAQVESWMDQNPPKLGINWASSLEVAFRSISWLWALCFFKDSTVLGSATFVRMLQFLYLHARHIETYLSTYFSPNTHLTGEALGLFYLGTFLPEFKEARRWRTSGLRILIEQLPIHVKSDGVYFEQSSYYHRYTTDFYTHLWLILHANGDEPPAELSEKLQLLLDHLMYISRPDGTTPLFGDDDGGRLVTLEPRAGNDFRAALSNGAAIFKRPDFKYVAGAIAEETFWLVGPKEVALLDSLDAVAPGHDSVGFEHGGIYVMRDGWAQDSNYLLFDCGPHGINNCGHAHADALSFEVASKGQSLLVDPGTYTYTASQENRDWFRSSAAHNTLTVDGESSSVSDGPFSWQTNANCKLATWISQKRFDFVSASHDGYLRLGDPTAHTRSILFIKNDYWIVRDRVEAESDHLIQLWFHFDASLPSVDSAPDEIRLSDGDGLPIFQLITFGQGGKFTETSGWVSRCYGSRDRAPVLGYSLQSRGSTELLTFLLPQGAAEREGFKVRELQTINGLAYEIDRGSTVDLFMVRDPRATSPQEVSNRQVVSDFDLTWARFAAEGAKAPEEVILFGGKTLALGEREILRSGKRIDYISVSSLGDQVRLETEAGVFDSRLPIFDLETALLDASGSERLN